MSKREASALDEGRDVISIARLVDSPPQKKQRRDHLVTNANQLSADEFRAQYIDDASLTYTTSILSPINPEPGKEVYSIAFRTAEDAGLVYLSTAMFMIERTQRTHYRNSSIGWHPKRKKAEMRDKSMRYLFAFQPDKKYAPGGFLLGFLSFMLTFDSTPSVPVLYIYELHVGKDDIGRGLGSHLLHAAEDIACRVGVEKIMLTCFLSNEKAIAFYRKHGYVKDVCSPGDRTVRRKVLKIDYWIMSKKVARSRAPKEISPS